MPHLRELTPEEADRLERRRAPKSKMDLSIYTGILDQMPMERWSGLLLDAEETTKTQKRRLTTAAKLRGHRLIYKPGPSERELYVKLTAQEKQRRGPRKPKTAEVPLFGENGEQGDAEADTDTPATNRSRARSW